jgi:glyoxylase-like metal-dependent hydrolase (beta-lactamase superfamily II)
MNQSVGPLNARSSVRRWEMDDVVFTYVVDGFMSMLPQAFLPAIPRSYWVDHSGEVDVDGRVLMSTGGLLVERAGHRLLIDAGFGRAAAHYPVGSVESGAFLRCLHDVGVNPADIDVFALTHLHLDHTGWMFSKSSNGAFAPTFPNAPYVLAEAEWRPHAGTQRTEETPDERSVVEPLGLHRQRCVVSDGGEIAPGSTALVTPGHSAGHASYVVTSSRGRRLIAFGDVFHVPAQLAHPRWGSAADENPAAVPQARARLLDELLAPDTYGFAIHFGDQPFGRVVRDAAGVPRWQPVPTEVLAPPPS